MSVVAYLGDSEAYGYNLARADCPSAQLAKSLSGGITPTISDIVGTWSDRLGYDHHNRVFTSGDVVVYDLAVPGDTSRGMLARYETDVAGRGPIDVLIVKCGENDAWAYSHDGPAINDATYGMDYSPGGFKENVLAICAAAVADGIAPVLATPAPHGTLEGCTPYRWQMFQDILKWLGSDMAWMSSSQTPQTTYPLTDEYAATYDVAHPAYPCYYASGSTYSLDNIHYNAAGVLAVIAASLPVVVDALPPATFTDLVGIMPRIPYTDLVGIMPAEFTFAYSPLSGGVINSRRIVRSAA